jgi:tRNA nucleotidyltransferase/poly(A) polymerase
MPDLYRKVRRRKQLAEQLRLLGKGLKRAGAAATLTKQAVKRFQRELSRNGQLIRMFKHKQRMLRKASPIKTTATQDALPLQGEGEE